jgi:hypothetical protein
VSDNVAKYLVGQKRDTSMQEMLATSFANIYTKLEEALDEIRQLNTKLTNLTRRDTTNHQC